MIMLALFGVCAVALMLFSYAFEYRSSWWVLIFALACIACALYGWFSGAWPLGVAEAVWALVAFRRWWLRRTHVNENFDVYQLINTKAKEEDQESKELEEVGDPQKSEDLQEPREAQEPEDAQALESVASSKVQGIDQSQQDVGRQIKRHAMPRWEPLLGVALLICFGLIGAFRSVAAPQGSRVLPQSQASPTQVTKSLEVTAITTDLQFTMTLTITPDSPGANVFTIQVFDEYIKPATNVTGIWLSFTADTSKVPQVVNAQPDGNTGKFTAQANLAPSGYWTVNFQVRTPDNVMHNASTVMSL